MGKYFFAFETLMLAIATFMDQRNPPRITISTLATLIIILAGLLYKHQSRCRAETWAYFCHHDGHPIFFVFSLPSEFLCPYCGGELGLLGEILECQDLDRKFYGVKSKTGTQWDPSFSERR